MLSLRKLLDFCLPMLGLEDFLCLVWFGGGVVDLVWFGSDSSGDSSVDIVTGTRILNKRSCKVFQVKHRYEVVTILNKRSFGSKTFTLLSKCRCSSVSKEGQTWWHEIGNQCKGWSCSLGGPRNLTWTYLIGKAFCTFLESEYIIKIGQDF